MGEWLNNRWWIREVSFCDVGVGKNGWREVIISFIIDGDGSVD